MATKKLALVYASYGTGHLQTVNALREAAGAMSADAEIIPVDLAEIAHSRVFDVTTRLFNKMPPWYRPIFAASYSATKNLPMGSRLKEGYIKNGLAELKAELDRIEPDAVVSAFPSATGMCALMKRNGELKAPVTAVITDADVHAGWLFSEIDRYIVMDEGTKQGIIDYGIAPERAFATGIPIRAQFALPHPRVEKHKTPTVLIAAGGKGVSTMLIELMRWVDKANVKLRLVILTGSGQTAYEYATSFAQTARHEVIVPGYITGMAEAMLSADAYITKPGGITMAESLACELPMIAYHPFPGQEESNLRLLTESGAALRMTLRDDPDELLLRVLYNDGDAMRAACRRLAKPNAAADAMRLILSDV